MTTEAAPFDRKNSFMISERNDPVSSERCFLAASGASSRIQRARRISSISEKDLSMLSVTEDSLPSPRIAEAVSSHAFWLFSSLDQSLSSRDAAEAMRLSIERSDDATGEMTNTWVSAFSLLYMLKSFEAP